jgi:hypothetical protein
MELRIAWMLRLAFILRADLRHRKGVQFWDSGDRARPASDKAEAENGTRPDQPQILTKETEL